MSKNAATTGTEALAAQEEMLAAMREDYFDVFGVYPTRAKEDKFLRDNPGAVGVWRATTPIALAESRPTRQEGA